MSAPTEPLGGGQPRHRRGRWVVWLLAGLMAVMATLLWRCASVNNRFTSGLANGLQPPEMAAAQYSDHAIRANLGGMAVEIPSYFAEYVEYDGDPGWGEKREGPRPVRTPESRLRSFGFYVRYPDMAGLSSPALREHKQNSRLAETTWISVGFNAGENYPGDGFMDRGALALVGKANLIDPVSNYERLPEMSHDLEVYAPSGIDPKTNAPYRRNNYAKDVFIYKNSLGKVEAQIACSNRDVLAPPCRHDFSLEPDAKVWVYMSYRRGMLPEWRNIQESVRKLVLEFQVEHHSHSATSSIKASNVGAASDNK